MINRKKILFDKDRQVVRARFFELKKVNKKHAPMFNLCTFEEYNYRPNGRKRSEREQTNLLTKLYEEKLFSLREKENYVVEEKKLVNQIPIIKVMQHMRFFV